MRVGVICIALGMAVSAQGGLMDRAQKACNQERYSQSCLAALVVYHCSSYTSVLHKLGRCLDRGREAARILDPLPTTRDSAVEVVAFPSELRYLLNQPFTEFYLKKLRSALSDGYRLRERVDLWGLSVELTGDRRKALWYIAVLLQDTSTQQVPTWYIEETGSGIPQSRVDLWAEVLDLLNPQQLRSENYKEWLTLYPPMKPVGSERRFSAKLYHFYTLAYLAMRLQWESADRGMAWFVPSLIEASYKFRQLDADRWPQAPLPFDITKKESAVIDMYTTYLASLWAVGSRRKPMEYGDFAENFADNPAQFMDTLFESATSPLSAESFRIDRVLP